MKHNNTVALIVYILFTSSLIYTGPSVRQKSKASAPGSPAITPVKKPLVENQKQPLIVVNDITKNDKRTPIDTSASDQPKPVTPPLPVLFVEKIKVSTERTHKIIDYFLNAATQIVSNQTPNNKTQLNEKLRALFDGLRYPIHRHLREVVTAYNDPNSFWCGSVLKDIMLSKADPLVKTNFIKAFNTLAKALKSFKIYHIDAQLKDDIDAQIQSLDTKIRELKTVAEPVQDLKTIAAIEISILNDSYIATLLHIKNFLDKDVLKKHLPQREGLIKYGYRGARKVTAASGRYILGKTYSYAAQQALKKIASFLKLKSSPPQSVTDLVPSVIKSARQFILDYGAPFWELFISAIMMPLIKQNTLLRLNLYLYKIPQLPKELNNNKLREIYDTQSDFMGYSAAFLVTYLNELAQKIVSDTELDTEHITQALQSAQIEVFRYRRLIISELGNDKAFTGNYLTFLHNQFLIEHNSHFEPEDLDRYIPKTVLTKERNEDGKVEVYFKVTPEGQNLVEQIEKRASNDPLNKIDLIKLRGPITNEQIKVIVQTFEKMRTKIINELKSWGSRSRYQLIQNYWLSVIDQEYGKKLDTHLITVASDCRALTAGALSLPIKDESGNTLYYSDNEPITIHAPVSSPYAEQELRSILEKFYIKPLTRVADILSKKILNDKLPKGKDWYIKYPLLYAKFGVKFNTFLIKKIADQGLIPLAIAYFTGGASAVKTKLLDMTTSFSGVASLLLDVDISAFTSLASWKTLKSGWQKLPSWGDRFSNTWDKGSDLFEKIITIQKGVDAISDIKSSVTRPIQHIINQ